MWALSMPYSLLAGSSRVFLSSGLLRDRYQHHRPSVRCSAVSACGGGTVRTTLNRDGTVTYHFSETVQQESLLQDKGGFFVTKGSHESKSIASEHNIASVAEQDSRDDGEHQGGNHSTPAENGLVDQDSNGAVFPPLNGSAISSLLGGLPQVVKNGNHHSEVLRNGSLLHTDTVDGATHAPQQTSMRGSPSEVGRSMQHNHASFSGRWLSPPEHAQSSKQGTRESGPAAKGARRRRGDQEKEASVKEVCSNIAKVDSLVALNLFSDLSTSGRLEEALQIVERSVKAKRDDIVSRLRHKHFLREAADQACGPRRRQATKLAMRFVQVLPRRYTDARTYNMLISVCVKAKDLTEALHAADMLKSTGQKLDTILYTNLMMVCAAVGNADKAFDLYAAMKAEGVRTEPQVYTALIAACSREILEAPPGNRRLQLVLLERAQGVLAEMQAAKQHPDAILWNALITAAGRAGQLQRAFHTLEDMQGSGCKADKHTYAALIDACARASRADLAIRVYHRALRERCDQALLIYTSAIAACRAAQPVDMQTAMDIYRDMQRNGVEGDACLYATLMGVAAVSGDLQLAFSIQEDMIMDGLRPCLITQSALINACIDCNELERARELYRDLQKSGHVPSLLAFNNLINAHGRAGRLGDAVTLLRDLAAAKLKPDAFTFAAVLNACQRANEAELAFDVYRIMKQQGHAVDEAVCFILLRLCYNRLRDSWYPGGYPPRKSNLKGGIYGMHAAGAMLLQALSGGSDAGERVGALGDVGWAQRAVNVYREFLSAGHKPAPHVVERVLACLRQPLPPKPSTPPSLVAPFQVGMNGLGEDHQAAEALLQGNSRDPGKLFDPRAVIILEEAIGLGALPQFSLASAQPLDLRHVPPCTAEVYVLAIVGAMQRGADLNQQTDLTILVPSYDPAEIFSPSYGHDEPNAVATEAAAAFPVPGAWSGGGLEGKVELGRGQQARSETGLGVAGMLRRIGLWAVEDAVKGQITVPGKELVRWLRAADRAALQARNESLSILQEQKWIGGSITEQQKNIRMGLNQGRYRSKPPRAHTGK